MNESDTVDALRKDYDAFKSNLDQLFLILNGMIVLLMQCGFAFLEAGSVRSKNSTNILIKNMLDVFIAGISYWLLGYAFAFGDDWSSFIGYSKFASHGMAETDYAFFFFQFVFAATAATIVSGAVAERCHFVAYLVYSVVLTSFIYPVVTHWAWSDDGWLKMGREYEDSSGTPYSVTYQDFAGSGVVHMVGGTAAIIAAFFIGPRLGRFDKGGQVNQIRGHSVPLAALGGFILVFGFMAFNGGSQASISEPGDGAKVALAVTNTTISASLSAIVTLLLNKIAGNGRWSLLLTMNACLTGMVSICAGCDVYDTWASAVIGIIAAGVYKLSSALVLKLKIDDPLDAFAVHFGGGLWGVIAISLFNPNGSILFDWNEPAFMGLAWQLAASVSIASWTGVLCTVMFYVLGALNVLRVNEDTERKGLDIFKHGEPSYPLEAYGHGWIESIIATKLGNGVMEYPDENLYPYQANHAYRIATQRNGGCDNLAVEVSVEDRGSYESPETVMFSIDGKATNSEQCSEKPTSSEIPNSQATQL